MLPCRMLRLRENPYLVPEVIPEGKEIAGYELADFRFQAGKFAQTVKYQIVQKECVQCCVYHVEAGCEGDLFRSLGPKSPKALYQEVKRYTNGITYDVGGKKSYYIIERDYQYVAAPEPYAAAHQILDKLYNQLLCLFGNFHPQALNP